jgi:glycerol-3-phosphate dehydrogenase (NAD(P)+)
MKVQPDSTIVGRQRVSVLGAGAWGMTLALLAHEAGHEATLVAHREDAATFMRRERRHPNSLPGVPIPDPIQIGHSGRHTLSDADIVIIAVPTQRLREAVTPLQEVLATRTILCAAKGLEVGTLMRPSQILESVLGTGVSVGVLSGPNLSAEIAAGKPTSTVIASDDTSLAERLVPILHSNRFRAYVSADVIGVEMGGALKNIIAIGAGIADGLDAGDNAKAAFMTRGIAEIARLGVAAGAQPLTFAGLSGIGDLIATCASPLSRNHQVGVALAGGRTLDDIVRGMTETAEGIATTRAARELGRRLGVELPIVDQMHRVLFEGLSPLEAVARLMEREPRHEFVDLRT